ncbi:hypothetical protein F4556_001921 [Kitasatospora gansuensis]|uniref:Uncharacterized protein n=1 Tax=Kitasatospora gansuensis TaxID=258050 RepID=A0A7W7S9H5_9ACTN|nr:hypothetical protein [Kitasatospora gansuensis]MBB4946386.1 hypothetical protein [Kitasatospora gansuensis]
MRWLTLYARSRQVPLSAALVALVTLLVRFLVDGGVDGSGDQPVALLVLTASVAAATVGLVGQDSALDRTAAIRWVPRRAAHVLLVGVFAGAALLAVQAVGPELATTGLVVRACAGLVGLAALGATLCGAQYAWTLPTGWLALVFFTPPLPGTLGEAAGWMTLTPATTVSTGTAWALLAVGTLLYAVVGPRR